MRCSEIPTYAKSLKSRLKKTPSILRSTCYFWWMDKTQDFSLDDSGAVDDEYTLIELCWNGHKLYVVNTLYFGFFKPLKGLMN
jgi:hypothetical protein